MQHEKIIKLQGLHSRFESNAREGKTHTVFLFPSTETKDIIGYCKCKSGQRTVGGCGHVVASLYFLAWELQGSPISEYAPNSNKNMSEIVDLTQWVRENRQNSQ